MEGDLTDFLLGGILVLLLAQLGIFGWFLHAGYRIRRVFGGRGRSPMGSDLYSVFRWIKRIGALLVDKRGVARLLLVQVEPGLNRIIADVSGGGQVTALLQHMCARPPLQPGQRLVLDIGANDGFQGSHSFNFIQLGWMAALVEPNPEAYEEILANVAGKRLEGAEHRVVTRNVAVTEQTCGPVTLYLRGWRYTASSLVDDGADRTEVEVPGESVSGLLSGIEAEFRERGLMRSLPKEPGVLSIDVEGLDYEVLKGFMSWGLRPCYVLVEARMGPDRFDQLMEPLGYDRFAHFHDDLLYYRPPSE